MQLAATEEARGGLSAGLLHFALKTKRSLDEPAIEKSIYENFPGITISGLLSVLVTGGCRGLRRR